MSWGRIAVIAVSMIASLWATSARAARGGGFKMPPPSSAAASPDSSGLVYFSIGAKALYGTMASVDSSSVVSRNLSVLGAELSLGLRAFSFIVGAGAEYSLWKQLADPSSIAGSNTQGTQTNVAAVLGYQLSSFVLIGKYYVSSSYALDVADAAGNKVTYSVPSPGYALQILYQVSGSSHVGLEYSSLQYGKQSSGPTETTLTGGAKLNASAVGLVYTWIL